jgi:hypothetical protein
MEWLPTNEDFFPRSRRAIKITTGIFPIFRGLFFEPDNEIGKKDHLWTDTREVVCWNE